MSDYISREEAKKAVVKAIGQGYSPFNAIVMIPAANVRPVVRGRWSFDNNIFTDADGVSRSGMRGYKCSKCDGFCIGESNYCPNCGAKMETEGGE